LFKVSNADGNGNAMIVEGNYAFKLEGAATGSKVTNNLLNQREVKIIVDVSAFLSSAPE
jgi:hypothetical protein